MEGELHRLFPVRELLEYQDKFVNWILTCDALDRVINKHIPQTTDYLGSNS